MNSTRKKRIFISFAMEDRKQRDMFVGQAKHDKTPFEFVDMSVDEPWDEKWRTQCRSRIKGCDGVIALISKNTAAAQGAVWEIKCAIEEKIPLIGVWAYKDDRTKPPSIFGDNKVIEWTWDGIAAFIDKV